MDDGDLALRNTTYRLFAELGWAPSAAEVAAHDGRDVAEVRDGWRRLHDAHALVVDPASGELLMAHPFSAVPTRHRVKADGRWWYANCAWDAFGICAALRVDGCIASQCPECGDCLRVTVADGQPDADSLLFHCLVPASHWWEDIVFT
jgi:alkylmercury lyase-like protein